MNLIDKILSTYQKEEVKRNPVCYFYNLASVFDKINLIQRNAPKNISLYYAMKANPNPELIAGIIKNHYVKGIEIASIGELEIASKHTNDILFTGPGKTHFELEQSIKNCIRLINAESLLELIRIQKIAEAKNEIVNVLLRINTNYYIEGAYENMSGISTKMGIDEIDIKDVFYYTNNNLKNIKIQGIHVFSASGVFDHSLLLKYNNYVFNLAKHIEETCKTTLNIIDFGGGFGFDCASTITEFNVKEYFEVLSKIIRKYNFEKKELIFELGKFLVSECGYYTSEIIDIKTIKNKKHIILAGGTNHMRLPHATGRKHPLFIIPRHLKELYLKQENVNKEIVDISGPLCFADDKLSWDEYIESAFVGDIIVFKNAGAYCYSLSSINMLSHPHPLEILL